MSFRFNNQIVTDGLILYLDAANPVSTTSTSTTWNNLTSINVGVGTKNATTFDSTNGGSLVFNGSTSYVSASVVDIVPLNVGLSGSVTIDAFINYTSAGNIFVFGTESPFNAVYGIGVGTRPTVLANNIGTSVGNTTILANTWYNIIMTYDSAGGGSCYLNGTFLANHDTSTNSTSGATKWIVGKWGFSPYTGKIASIRIYNKALSASEALQNYKATKYRFGL